VSSTEDELAMLTHSLWKQSVLEMKETWHHAQEISATVSKNLYFFIWRQIILRTPFFEKEIITIDFVYHFIKSLTDFSAQQCHVEFSSNYLIKRDFLKIINLCRQIILRTPIFSAS
jgi:hypothetical protein